MNQFINKLNLLHVEVYQMKYYDAYLLYYLVLLVVIVVFTFLRIEVGDEKKLRIAQ